MKFLSAIGSAFSSGWSHRGTTAAGLVSLALCAGKCYLMAAAPATINPETVTTAAGLFSAGVTGLLASDPGKSGQLITQGAQGIGSLATSLAPVADIDQGGLSPLPPDHPLAGVMSEIAPLVEAAGMDAAKVARAQKLAEIGAGITAALAPYQGKSGS